MASVLAAVPDMANSAEWMPIRAQVIHGYDGDTLGIEAEIWPGIVVRDNIRISGVDTPEVHGKCEDEKSAAKKAKAIAMMLSPIGSMVTVYAKGRDKYGRILARVVSPSGRDLAGTLISEGLARPYDGGARKSWCEGK